MARSETISFLFNHLCELRETQRRLLLCTIENKELAQANEDLKEAIHEELDFFGII